MPSYAPSLGRERPALAGRGIGWIEWLAGLQHAKAEMEQLAHGGYRDLLWPQAALLRQPIAQVADDRIDPEGAERRQVERAAQIAVADPGYPRGSLGFAGLVLTRVKPG